MSATQFHQLSFVVFLCCFLLSVGLFVGGALKRQEGWVRVACIAFAITAFVTLPVYFSGHATRPEMPVLSEAAEFAIDKHLRMSKFAFVGVWVTGIAGAGTLVYFRRRPLPDWLIPNIFFLIFMTVTFTARSWVTANKIATELRPPPAASSVINPP